MLLGIAVIQVKVAETSRVVRHLYIKEHNVTDTHTCKPNGRTLLVLNVPPYVTEVKNLLPITFLLYVVCCCMLDPFRLHFSVFTCNVCLPIFFIKVFNSASAYQAVQRHYNYRQDVCLSDPLSETGMCWYCVKTMLDC